MLAISILGITGKMGKCLLAKALEDPELRLVGALASPHSSSLGTDVGALIGAQKLGVPLQADSKEALAPCAVAIDFSVNEAALEHILAARSAKKALVLGTTGLTADVIQAIEEAAQEIPILVSANFSIGIALCMEMAPLLSRMLFGRYTIDIFETHHKHKKDRPSGTALALAQALGKGTIHHEEIQMPRNKEQICIHSERVEETVGEHLLVFEGSEERLEIKHTTLARAAFAQGALLAAKWLASQAPGSYSFEDVLRESRISLS